MDNKVFIIVSSKDEQAMIDNIIRENVKNGNIEYCIEKGRSSKIITADTLLTVKPEDKIVMCYNYLTDVDVIKNEADTNLYYMLSYPASSNRLKLCGFTPTIEKELDISKDDMLNQINDKRNSILKNENIHGMIEFING